MKTYIVRWFDGGTPSYKEIEASGLPEAKHKAFQILCNNSGDRLISDVEVFERRFTFGCNGEHNPKPNRCNSEYAPRDYYTGMKIRKGGATV